ncbi:rhodanese domain-containing protein CG4456 isoform X5 [Phlebotomus papatasi]|uniref:rhodanese domain-containing protein CG4456 isoform X5 n=1 Tax=Phlebotomus papatasi TaxID=29031 RepID=UPI002483CF77|nr:rhodanese domain-containing protein CG4456 isoform X5 [Phlebotomus papatasi]
MLNLVKNRAGCCRWMYNGTFNAAVRGISTVNRRKMVLFTETPAAKGLLSKVSSSSTVVSRAFSSGTMKIATYEEVKDLCNHPEKLLIDVREPHELLETGSIPTSINIPLGQVQTIFSDDTSNEDFRGRFGREKPSKDAQIIFMCKVGIRSDKAAQTVTELGFRNAKNYKGSWTEWSEKEGLPAPK